jgi:dGTPase
MAHDYTLNLTYEVRDGVVCHYGEGDEQSLQPDRGKNIKAVEPDAARKQTPGTLEGCVVRMSDRIAYLGRDFEDAVVAGIIKEGTLPQDVEHSLGKSNSEIIGALIHDIIQQSKGLDRIQLSDEKFGSYAKLKQFNSQKIYESRKLTRQYHRIHMMLRDIFDLFYEVVQKTKRGQEKRDLYDGYIHKVFYEFLDDMQYPDEEVDAQIVSDFVAGMTDDFAIGAFQGLFLVSPQV